MKIALIGNGGREHALAWKLAQSPRVKKIYAFGDNPGIGQLAEIHPVNTDDFKVLAAFLKKEKVDITLVGPEAPLVNGIVDYLFDQGLGVFGPKKAAAMLEGSKAFSKEIMLEAGVPTAAYREFNAALPALAYIRQQNSFPTVIKADGLAAGKGVAIAGDLKEAEAFLQEVFDKKVFGDAGSKVIVEEFMQGEEVSLFALTDGKTVRYLSPAQDHKQIFEGDLGPNTGGMGTYAPTALISDELLEDIDQRIIKPIFETLRNRGIEYRGVLFAGLMMTQAGPKVLEFNCRFGDPETQVLMPLLETDLALILEKTLKQELHELEIELSTKKAVCFVAAAGGYPGDYKKGTPIHGLDKVKTTLFYAGVKEENKRFLTNGGRVLGLVALGGSIEEARAKALYELEKVSFEGMQVRKDIGSKEVKRPKVAVMMGSDSDLPVVAEGLKILEILEIPFEVHVLSAHRSPEELLPMAKGWKYKDLQVVIAAAGMAAHLPGVLAGHVEIPVIGIPIESKLQGLDALYSIVNMPAGVPVATVTLGKSGAKNAALLAAKILALKYPQIAKNLKNYQAKEKTAALEKEKLLQEIGYRAYLESKKL